MKTMRRLEFLPRLASTSALVLALVSCKAHDEGNSALATDAQVRERLLATQCAVIADRVDAFPGSGGVLLRSYEPAAASASKDDAALATAAFSYDNALAVIALVACKKPAQARRVAEALRLATSAGRLRNVYRAGAVENPPLPNGWWSEADSRWVEDAYQMSTATGNVAWVALAMLTMAAQEDDPRWRETAALLARWTIDHAHGARDVGGFTGGMHGFDGAEQKLGWKSTEHNVDLVAVFDALTAAEPQADWSRYRDEALAFVDAQWDISDGHFRIGTLPDGKTPNVDSGGLDAQLWPLLLREARDDWRRSLEHVAQRHGVGDGFDFNEDRDGIWTEGTAQAALAFAWLGREPEAQRALRYLEKQQAMRPADGYLLATDRERITTGLAINPQSDSADFYYFQRPHLAASAWTVLAAAKWNPFTPRQASSVPADIGTPVSHAAAISR